MERYRKDPLFAIRESGLDLKNLRGDPLEQLARLGAKLILTEYLEAEVAEKLNRGWYERTEEAKGYRNGHRRRTVMCGVGKLELDVPRGETEEPFESMILRAWQRKSDTLMKTLPSLYVEGLSTRDFKRGLQPLWEDAGVSKSTISRANVQIREAFVKWRRRDLSGEDVLFLFLDGYYERVRAGSKEKEALLVAHGLRRDGARALLGVYLGVKESADSWKLALDDLVARGLKPPALVISDGNPGLIQAVKRTWPQVARQRCVAHRTRNVLARVPRKDWQLVRKALNRIFYAANLEEALAAAAQFTARYGETYPEACGVLGTGLSDCLTFFRFPQHFWKRIRTSNPLERTFVEVRRRTRVVGRFPTELSALSLVWSVLDQNSARWRGILVKPEWLLGVAKAEESLRSDPIRIRGFEEFGVAS